MPIKIPPHAGQIVLCDYKGFIIPEMVKRRPVIVITPKSRRDQGLCAVIPLSTTPPKIVEKHHIIIDLPEEIVAGGKLAKNCWAKCDIINTVSLERLDLIRTGKNKEGKRSYSYYKISYDTLNSIRNAVFFRLGGKV